MAGFAVVIPAYNEAVAIRQVARETLRFASTVIVVNDGSTDETGRLLESLPVTLLEHPDNLGKGQALLTGFKHALQLGVDYIVTIDGDGQHRGEDIPRLMAVATARGTNTIVIGSRLGSPDRIPFSRYWANRLASFWLSWASGYPIDDSQSGLRVLPAPVLEGILQELEAKYRRMRGGFTLESEMLIVAGRLGVRTVAVPVAAIYDTPTRKSHFRPVRDFALIARMVTGRMVLSGMYPIGLIRWLQWRLLRRTRAMAHESNPLRRNG